MPTVEELRRWLRGEHIDGLSESYRDKELDSARSKLLTLMLRKSGYLAWSRHVYANIEADAASSMMKSLIAKDLEEFIYERPDLSTYCAGSDWEKSSWWTMESLKEAASKISLKAVRKTPGPGIPVKELPVAITDAAFRGCWSSRVLRVRHAFVPEPCHHESLSAV